MRRKTVTTFLLAAALAFMPMGGHLAMTAEASGTEAVGGSETGTDGEAEDGSETDEKSAEELIVLGWTEDGKPSIYVDPNIINDKRVYIREGQVDVASVTVLKDGEVVFADPGSYLLPIADAVIRNFVDWAMEYNGSGTYQYSCSILKGERSLSPEYVYVEPGEEEPGEDEGNGGSTTEPGGNAAAASQPKPWTPTPEEVKLYEACGEEEPVFVENANNAYSVTVANSIQGFLCWNAFDSVRGDYTIGRTYNIYPTDLGKVYQMDSKAEITLTIPEALQAGNRSFQMLVVTEDGKPAVLKDLDSNPNTITFETDAYYAFALTYKD